MKRLEHGGHPLPIHHMADLDELGSGGALLLPVLDGSRPALQIASAQRRLLAADRLRPTGRGRVDDVHPTLESTQPTASPSHYGM